MSTTTLITMTEEQLLNVAEMSGRRGANEVLERVVKQRALTTTQMAEILSVKADTIRRRMIQGKIPGAFQIGTEWRIMEYDCDEYIESLKQIHNES